MPASLPVLHATLSRYADGLREDGATACRIADRRALFADLPRETVLNHLLWMCEGALQFLADGRVQKARRWLGFIEGSLWTLNVYSIESIKDHGVVQGGTPDGIPHTLPDEEAPVQMGDAVSSVDGLVAPTVAGA